MPTASAPSRLPFSRNPGFHARSIDEANAMYSRLTAPVHIEPLPSKGPYSLRAHHLALGPLAFSSSECSMGVYAECHGVPDAYFLSMSLNDAAAESRNGTVCTPVVRGRFAVLCAPAERTKVLCEAGYQCLQVIIPQKAVCDAMVTLTGAEARPPHLQRSIAVDAAGAGPLLRLLAAIVDEAKRDTPAFDAPGAGALWAEALILRLVLAQPQSRSRLFGDRARAAEPRHVRRAAEYLDTHLHMPVTMAELSRVAGASARSLQLAFQKYRGCSPLEFLQARRLERARVLLLTSEPEVSVSQVARLAGLSHLGRFSVRYRARFGESPRDTLRQALKTGAP